VIGGRDVESYFSPSDGTTFHILSLLTAAQHSIGFELLTFTRTDLSAELVAKKQQGVKVRGDLDDDSDSGSQYAYLTGNGVDVRLKTGASGLLHHKYCIVDAEDPTWNSITLTGSHNWSSAAENSNNENTLILHDFDITNQYLQEFAARYYQFGGSDPINIVGVDPQGAPRAIELSQNQPNPFWRGTTIGYALPARNRVVLRLYDVHGRVVRTVMNQEQPAGRYKVGLAAGALPSGVYFYRLQVGSLVQQRKLVLLR